MKPEGSGVPDLHDVPTERLSIDLPCSNVPDFHKVTLIWKNITYKVKNNKEIRTILENVSGCILPGEITAILGPSGAGKTTLLNVLSGFHTQNYTGEMYVNGTEYSARTFRKLNSYIMHGDHLLPYLTVSETMHVAASFKLRRQVSVKERSDLINSMINEWGLQDCISTLVKNISSGQRKRLIVAQDLVNNPPVVFLDEPTSGLDSSTSFQCVHLLKTLAKKGHTVVFTVHQPGSKLFHQFDKVYMLAEGQCIYRGSVDDLRDFFSKNHFVCPPYYNPADFLTEIAQGDFGNYNRKLAEGLQSEDCAISHGGLNNQFEQNPNGVESIDFPLLNKEIQGVEDYKSSLCTQILFLLRRSFITIYRDPMLFHVRLVAHIITGLIIGAIYYNAGNKASKLFSNVTLLFYSLTFLVFCGMMPTLLTFPLETNVFSRERMNNWYSVKAYVIAKILADIPFQILFPILFSSIVYWITSQPPEISRFLLFLLISVLISFLTQSVGLLSGAIFRSQVSVFFGTAVSMPLILFCGYGVPLEDIPGYISWIGWLSYLRYAFEGIMITVYGMNRGEFECDDIENGKITDLCFFTDGSAFLEFMEISDSKLCRDILLLVVIDIILKFAIYLVLRFQCALKPSWFRSWFRKTVLSV